jgi:iron complex outermembrane receptor protein
LNDQSIFTKIKYDLTQKISLFTDLQLKKTSIEAIGKDNDLIPFNIDKNYNFFNPKFGFSFKPNTKTILNASYGIANSQPNRSDFIDALSNAHPKPERLSDLELEMQYQGKNWSSILTFYNMQYKDQLILTGALNDVGSSLRLNVPSSHRRGIEWQGTYLPIYFLSLTGNINYSKNTIKKFEYLLYDYENNGVQTTTYQNTPISYSPALIAYSELGLSYKSFKLNLIGKYVGKQYLDNTGAEERSLKPYLVFNSSFGWSHNLINHSKINLQFQVFNFGNLKYSSNGYTYSYLYSGLVTENFYYPQAGRHFMLSCKIDW